MNIKLVKLLEEYREQLVEMMDEWTYRRWDKTI